MTDIADPLTDGVVLVGKNQAKGYETAIQRE
jgi:hypothetical protein